LTVLFENGWTSAQSCGVVGEGEGDGLAEGEGLGDGLLLGVGLGVAVGLWLADGVALGVGLADGDELALGLALADWLGVAEAELSGTAARRPTASARPADSAFLDLLVATAGRWEQMLVALRRLAREACATAAPLAPLAITSNPAMMPNVAVWVRRIAIVIELPSPRCRPQQGRHTAVPYLIAVRMSRLTYSLLAPFDTSCSGRGHSPKGKLCRPTER
jgi:hypothetical protein